MFSCENDFMFRVIPVSLWIIYSDRFYYNTSFFFSKTMPDLEYNILSEWFNWLISYHDVKVDLIGK